MERLRAINRPMARWSAADLGERRASRGAGNVNSTTLPCPVCLTIARPRQPPGGKTRRSGLGKEPSRRTLQPSHAYRATGSAGPAPRTIVGASCPAQSVSANLARTGARGAARGESVAAFSRTLARGRRLRAAFPSTCAVVVLPGSRLGRKPSRPGGLPPPQTALGKPLPAGVELKRRIDLPCRAASSLRLCRSASSTICCVIMGAPGLALTSGNCTRLAGLCPPLPLSTARNPSATRSFSFAPVNAARDLASRKSSSGISKVVFMQATLPYSHKTANPVSRRRGCISLLWVAAPNRNLNSAPNLLRATGNQNWL